jgi:hypothetical protein
MKMTTLHFCVEANYINVFSVADGYVVDATTLTKSGFKEPCSLATATMTRYLVAGCIDGQLKNSGSSSSWQPVILRLKGILPAAFEVIAAMLPAETGRMPDDNLFKSSIAFNLNSYACSQCLKCCYV